MKRAAAYLCILVLFLLSGCSGSAGQMEPPTDAQGLYTGFSDVPGSCTMEEAGSLGYYVMLDLEDSKNRDAWNKFTRSVQDGQLSLIHI